MSKLETHSKINLTGFISSAVRHIGTYLSLLLTGVSLRVETVVVDLFVPFAVKCYLDHFDDGIYWKG